MFSFLHQVRHVAAQSARLVVFPLPVVQYSRNADQMSLITESSQPRSFAAHCLQSSGKDTNGMRLFVGGKGGTVSASVLSVSASVSGVACCWRSASAPLASCTESIKPLSINGFIALRKSDTLMRSRNAILSSGPSMSPLFGSLLSLASSHNMGASALLASGKQWKS